jgi:hypothetical protein
MLISHIRIFMIGLLACCMLMSMTIAEAQSDAPEPKHEAVKFASSALFFTASSGFMSLAQHNGAKECIAEDNRNGVGKLFNTSKAYGMRPNDFRVALFGAVILSTATIFELTHHPKAAKRLLIFAGTAQFGLLEQLNTQDATEALMATNQRHRAKRAEGL